MAYTGERIKCLEVATQAYSAILTKVQLKDTGSRSMADIASLSAKTVIMIAKEFEGYLDSTL